MNIKVPRKLIEVALPLDDINHEAAREKSLRHGHPSTLHLWWSRKPLAAARAALFAQLVDAPDTEAERELRKSLPTALSKITAGDNPIAAVDLAQAVIGPGMEIFSKYEAILSQSGEKMSVREALRLINQELLSAENFDSDTTFCIKWFEQHGWQEGDYGKAETLAKAKGISVEGVRDAGVLSAKRGKVRLLRCNEYPDKWSPEQDERLPAWEAAHHLIKTINNKGEAKAGHLLKQLPAKEDEIKQLGYHLYQVCDQNKWSEDAGDYDMLIQAWPELKKVA